jgi:1-acyl-sn-glycerol-3-phosphate acyltransferase
MRTRLGHARQVARTALGFAAFGAMAAVLGAVAPTLARIRARSRADRELWMQRLAHRAARRFMRLIEWLGVIERLDRGGERLAAPGPQLVVANHPTLLDVLALLAHMPQADLIVSVERAGNPFLRRLIASCGYLRNDAGPAIVDACAARLRAGRSLIVFPEGTRSPRGGLRPLQRGAAHIALRARCDLLPVVIRCDPPAFGKGQKWYDQPGRPVRLGLAVGEPIATQSVTRSLAASARGGALAQPAAARRLTAQLREVFEKGLEPSAWQAGARSEARPETRSRPEPAARSKRGSQSGAGSALGSEPRARSKLDLDSDSG